MLHETPLGWRAIPDVLNSLWGPALEIRQQQQPQLGQQQRAAQQRQQQQHRLQGSSGAEEDEGTGEGSSAAAPPPLLVLMFYIGGVSHAEIAAIRRLNEMELQGNVKAERRPENTRVQYLIITTEILNTRQLFRSMIEDVD